MLNRRILLGASLFAMAGISACSDPVKGPSLLTKDKAQARAADMDWDQLDAQTLGFWMLNSAEMGTPPASKKQLYVFFDMQCPHCGAMWHDYRTQGLPGVPIKWIPVGLLSRASTAQAATLLSKPAQNRATVLDDHELKLRDPRTPGGMASDHSVFSAFEDKIAKNTGILTALLQRMPSGESGVPFLVGAAHDGALYLNAGRVDMPALRAALKLPLPS